MLIISPNVSIDILYQLDSQIKKHQRVENVYKSAGGKGINVARVLKQLGMDCKLAMFLGPYNGKYIKDELNKLNLDFKYVNTTFDNRLCLNLLVEDNYEILEVGPTISENEKGLFMEIIQQFSNEDYLVISGSLPLGLGDNFYAMIINSVNSKVVVDCSGLALYFAYLANPYGIKVNESEFDELCDRINMQGSLVERILAIDIELVLVTCGSNGAILKYRSNVYKASILKYNILSATGSGDSVLAGLMSGLVKGIDIVDVFKLAMACGISNVLSINTGNVNLEQVLSISNDIDISMF